MLNNLHKFFQGRRKSLESCYLLYGMFNTVLLEFYCTVLCLIKAVHIVLLRLVFVVVFVLFFLFFLVVLLLVLFF